MVWIVLLSYSRFSGHVQGYRLKKETCYWKNIESWIQYIRAYPVIFKKQINAIALEPEAQRLAILLQCSNNSVKIMGGSFDGYSGDGTDVFQCVECGLHYGSMQQLTMHRAVDHQYRVEVARCINSNTCQVCLLQFQGRSAIHQHVKHQSPI